MILPSSVELFQAGRTGHSLVELSELHLREREVAVEFNRRNNVDPRAVKDLQASQVQSSFLRSRVILPQISSLGTYDIKISPEFLEKIAPGINF